MPTIKDIAREAGVSHGTVSNVINGRGNVSVEKIRLVWQAAEKLGRSQSAVANKLRLLRLEEPVADALHRYGLTERHARALLRLEDPEQRLAAVEHIGKNQLNVADAEAYIDRLVAQNQTTQPRRRSAYIIKDVRLFLNSVDRGVRLMQTAGVGAKVSRRDTEDAICLTVTIPRAKPQKDVS